MTPTARTSCAAAAGATLVSYAQRDHGRHVSVGHGTRDDGEAGEGDDVTGVERVQGGQAADIISPGPGLDRRPARLRRRRQRHADRRERRRPADGRGRASTSSTPAPARTRSSPPTASATPIDCGTNPAGAPDSASIDATEHRVRNCESSQVGKLALKARGSTVDVSWTHPKAWRKLRSVTVRVLDDRREIGAIKINPRAEQLAATGAVELGRRAR